MGSIPPARPQLVPPAFKKYAEIFGDEATYAYTNILNPTFSIKIIHNDSVTIYPISGLDHRMIMVALFHALGKMSGTIAYDKSVTVKFICNEFPRYTKNGGDEYQHYPTAKIFEMLIIEYIYNHRSEPIVADYLRLNGMSFTAIDMVKAVGNDFVRTLKIHVDVDDDKK